MARANAVRGSPARITVRYEGEGHSTGTIRHPAADDSAAAAALRVPTKATSPAPADSSGATALRSFSPSPSLPPPPWVGAPQPLRQFPYSHAINDSSASVPARFVAAAQSSLPRPTVARSEERRVGK